MNPILASLQSLKLPISKRFALSALVEISQQNRCSYNLLLNNNYISFLKCIFILKKGDLYSFIFQSLAKAGSGYK
eukprot:UN16246